MTDARFPERWLNDRRFIRLKDREFRGYLNALAFSVANRTDGVILRDDIELIRALDLGVADGLVTAGLWEVIDGGWHIREYEDTQTTRRELEVLDNLRRREREKKRRQREKSRGLSRGTGEDRTETGQDRQLEPRSIATCSWHLARPDEPCENCEGLSA
jgi:hypothetical protein